MSNQQYNNALAQMYFHFKERENDKRVKYLDYLNTVQWFFPIQAKLPAYGLFAKTVKSNAKWDYKPELTHIVN